MVRYHQKCENNELYNLNIVFLHRTPLYCTNPDFTIQFLLRVYYHHPILLNFFYITKSCLSFLLIPGTLRNTTRDTIPETCNISISVNICQNLMKIPDN